jgi:hypothetical protein
MLLSDEAFISSTLIKDEEFWGNVEILKGNL